MAHPATENRYLRFRGEHEYRSGDIYLEYELLVDVPEVPATRSDANPAHAIAGDVLREADDRDWQLRRDGQRIGDPEMWQVRHLFEGIRVEKRTAVPLAPGRGLLLRAEIITNGQGTIQGWQFLRTPECQPVTYCDAQPEVEVGGHIAKYPLERSRVWKPWTVWPDGKNAYPLKGEGGEAFLVADKIERDPKYDIARRLVSGLKRGAAFVEEPVADLRTGDILVRDETEPAIGGVVEPLTLDHYQELRERVQDGGPVTTELRPYVRPGGQVRTFIEDRRKWGQRLKVWRPRLWRVRYPAEVVSSPIKATSDEHAIFELLCSVGGRMPHV